MKRMLAGRGSTTSESTTAISRSGESKVPFAPVRRGVNGPASASPDSGAKLRIRSDTTDHLIARAGQQAKSQRRADLPQHRSSSPTLALLPLRHQARYPFPLSHLWLKSMSIYIVDEVIKTPGSSLSPGTHVQLFTAVAAVTPKACLRF
jgi:hypothetical protein